MSHEILPDEIDQEAKHGGIEAFEDSKKVEVELFMCDRCDTAVSHPVHAYDDDTPYCQKCLDFLEGMAEAQWEAQREDGLLASFA